MTPDYTASDCMYAWAATEWDYNSAGYGTKTLLNAMLHEAKWYIHQRMIPHSLIPSVRFYRETDGFLQEQRSYDMGVSAGQGPSLLN
jgi:hypothetical protein